MRIPVVSLLLAATAFTASADGPFKSTVGFSVTTNVGFGNDLFVTGNHPDIGNWNPTLGAKLYWTAGNVWTGNVAVEAGVSIDYKPVVLPLSYTGFCELDNAGFIPPGDGGHLVRAIPPAPSAPYSGKSVYYHSGLTNVTIIYSIGGGAFTSSPLEQVGPGRSGGEFLHAVHNIGVAGESIEFVMSGKSGTNTFYDNAPYEGYGTPPNNNYFTTLDAFFLQDGDIFNYWPPTSVSPPFIINSNAVSTHAPSPNRTMRIYLPRGYSENTWKRYPVMYMHDGQNVFSPSDSTTPWGAETTATRETSQGRMRETIIVALNSTADRTREYLPPEDNYGGQGFGDAYSKFLVYDVKAKIDTEFRTLPDRKNTMTAGSSSGGLITTYLGWHTNVFGGIGSFSPAYLISPNFNTRIDVEPKQPIRIYTDMGTDGEPEIYLVEDYWVVLDHLLRDGYVENDDLLSTLACGALHNEFDWAARLPDCFRFLLNIWDERNALAHLEYSPEILSAPGDDSTINVNHTSLAGWTYRLDAAPSVDGPWSTIYTGSTETLPWSEQTLMDTNPAGTLRAYRVTGQ